MLKELFARAEAQMPVSVMARVALQWAIEPAWIDEVFEAHRQRQYPRELLFSTVVELVSLVSLGLRPSLHAAARKAEKLPVSLAALYDKVNRTEPAILRALVSGSAERLAAVVQALQPQSSLPGWRLRVLDGNHLPASDKRLAALRDQRAAALPGHTLVVYDPDTTLVTDIVACEDAHASERSAMAPLLECAEAGEAWIADRNFRTRSLLQGWHDAQAGFIVREHSRHPHLIREGRWRACGRAETGAVFEQELWVDEEQPPWRRIELRLDQPTESGETTIRLWSNLPRTVSASKLAELYRKRWRIEGLFQRLESVLHSEIRTLGRPRAALAYNVLSVLKRSIEQAHRDSAPELDVSTYYLALDIRTEYPGMLLVLPPAQWAPWSSADPPAIAEYLLQLARHVEPKRMRTSKRGPKVRKPKTYIDAAAASAHVSTARVLRQARAQRP